MIEISDLTFRRSDGTSERTIIDGLTLQIEAGAQVALVGDSGAGKTTLLRLIAAIEPIQQGEIAVAGTALSALSQTEGAKHRTKQGMVFQDYQLLSTLSARDNIELSCYLRKQKLDKPLLQRLTAALGIEQLLDRYPQQLSGGEQQRVAIARALIHKPQLVLADEPTGNLDQAASVGVADLLVSLCQQLSTTLIIATHSQQLASACQARFRLANGQITIEGVH